MRWAVGHLPALVALGAVLLYTLGIVGTVGAIRASDLDVSQAIGRIPIEAHLRNGIAILVKPATLIGIGLYVLVYVATRDFSKWLPAEPEKETREAEATGEVAEPDADSPDTEQEGDEVGDDKPPGLVVRTLGWLRQYWSIACALVAAASFAVVWPWPAALYVLVTVGGLALPYVLLEDYERRVRAYLWVLALLTIGIAAIDALFRADPLSTGRVVTERRVVTAPIIASDGGLLYIGPSRSNRIYAAIPAARIVSVTATPRKRSDEPSLLNALGVDWR